MNLADNQPQPTNPPQHGVSNPTPNPNPPNDWVAVPPQWDIKYHSRTENSYLIDERDMNSLSTPIFEPTAFTALTTFCMTLFGTNAYECLRDKKFLPGEAVFVGVLGLAFLIITSVKFKNRKSAIDHIKAKSAPVKMGPKREG